MSMAASDDRCRALTTSGRRCKNRGSELCYYHANPKEHEARIRAGLIKASADLYLKACEMFGPEHPTTREVEALLAEAPA